MPHAGRSRYDLDMSSRGKVAIGAVTLLVVVAGLIGYAHWNLHRLTGGAADWSTPVNLDGGIATAGPNAFVMDRRDGLTVLRVSDGTVLRELGGQDPDPDYVWLGQDGSFVVRGSVLDDEVPYAAYDENGERLWSTTFSPAPQVTAIGPQGVTVSCIGPGCATTTYDDSGEELWSLPTTAEDDVGSGWGSGPDWRQHTDARAAWRNESPVTVATVPTAERSGRLHTVDETGTLSRLSIPAEHSSVVEDTMIEVTSDDDGCHVRAVRDDREAWSTTTDCDGRRLDGFPYQLVLDHRLYVDVDGDATLTVDLAERDAHLLPLRRSSFDPETTASVSVGASAVVKQDGAAITVIDPNTGEELWQERFRTGRGIGDDVLYPGVHTEGAVVDVKTLFKGFWRALAVGADRPKARAVIHDARTGEERASFVSDQIWDVLGLPDGSALVLSDGILHRIAVD